MLNPGLAFRLSENTSAVLTELKAWVEERHFPAHFPVEVRFVKGDDLMLSQSTGVDSTTINILMYRYVMYTAHYYPCMISINCS